MSTITFVDPSGKPIANGTLRVHLNADAKGGSSQVSSKVFNIPLDANGVADTSSVKLPSSLSNGFGTNQSPVYVVEVYSATGELVFGPNSINSPVLPSPLQ